MNAFLKNLVAILFAGHMIGYRKMDTAFGATACENLAAALGRHSQTKAVLVDSSAS